MALSGMPRQTPLPDPMPTTPGHSRNGSSQKRWLLVQPRNPARLLVEAFSKPSLPLGLLMVATLARQQFATRTPEHVIEEIRYHQERLGRRALHFSFMDDNIYARSSFVEELLERMIGLGVRWNANISMNFLQKPHIPALAKRAGCEVLNIGFESLDPETIKQVGKGSNRVTQYDTVVANVQRQGIAIQGYFIFGLDTDTEASFQQTYDFNHAQPDRDAGLYPGDPVPGHALVCRDGATAPAPGLG